MTNKRVFLKSRLISSLLALALLCVPLRALCETSLLDAFGQADGDTYENAYLGLRCVLPGWQFDDTEDILTANGMTRAQADTALSKFHALNKRYMLAQASRTVLFPLVFAVDMLYLGRQTALSLQGDSLTRFVERQVAASQQQMKSQGYEIGDLSVFKMDVDGRPLPCVVQEMRLNGVPYFARSVYYLQGEYLVEIAVGTFVVDLTKSVLSGVTWLEDDE